MGYVPRDSFYLFCLISIVNTRLLKKQNVNAHSYFWYFSNLWMVCFIFVDNLLTKISCFLYYYLKDMSSGESILFAPRLPADYAVWLGEIKSLSYFKVIVLYKLIDKITDNRMYVHWFWNFSFSLFRISTWFILYTIPMRLQKFCNNEIRDQENPCYISSTDSILIATTFPNRHTLRCFESIPHPNSIFLLLISEGFNNSAF